MRFDRRVTGILCAFACLGATLAAAPAAHAKAELTVSPTILRLDADAGENLVQPITVTAGEDEAIVVELVHADFGFEDESYEVTLIRDDAPETTSFSTRGWFSLPKQRYRIAKGRSMQLPLSVRVPKNTPAGTYLGAALIRVVPAESAPGSSQVQAVPETGPLLFIAVEGGEPPKPGFDRFTVPGWVDQGPIRPTIFVENDGDEFFTYEGTIELKGPGKDDTVEVRQQFVVPGQPRRLTTSADEKDEAGRPELGRKDLGFGRYEVTARLRIEPTGRTLVATRTIWVIPSWVWALGIILAVAFAISAALLVRWILERRRLAPFLAEAQTELAREEAVAGERSADDADDDELGLDADDGYDLDESIDVGDDDDSVDVDEELDPDDDYVR